MAIEKLCNPMIAVVVSSWLRLLRSRIEAPLKLSVGSYGTRNVIEVIESWFWELSTDCPVLCLFF